MGTLWIPGAERITPSKPGGLITSTAPPRAVWHTTQNPSGDPKQWANVIATLRAKSAEPQVLWDPVSDRLGQFMPLNLSGRALKNDGTTQTNRVGRVCIQIEVVAYAEKPFTAYWKPGPNFRALWAALLSWNIPELQPAGAFPKFIASPPHNVPEDDRDRPTWLSKGGHYSHSQIPGNSHGDCGGVSFPAMVAAGKPLTPAAPTKPAVGQEDDMSAQDVADGIRMYMRDFFKDGQGTGDTIWDQARAHNQAVEEKLDNLATAVNNLATAIGRMNA